MFRRITALLISLPLILCLLIPVSAQTVPCIVDEAELLLSEETAVLEEKAAALKALYNIHAVVLTVDSLGGSSAQDYADDYYDSADYGNDGVLFLLAMAEREWYISTSGSLIYALTDYGIQQLGERVVPFLAEEEWFDAFYVYLDSLPGYLDAYESGNPMDGFSDYSKGYYHGDQEEVVYYEEEPSPSFFLSLMIGILISGVVVLIMRLSMNTRRPQRSASVYMDQGSWNLTQHRDVFLYSNVTKTKKQDPPKSSGGGSSVHRSSGGRSHGGGGGKF